MTWAQIERRREQLGISRSRMCRAAGISESTFYKGIKKGGGPTAVVASALARALDIESERQEA